MTAGPAAQVRAKLDGTMTATGFGPGFGIHTLDATAREGFEVRATRAPGVILHCFLEGRTEARLSGRTMGLGQAGDAPPRLVFTATEEPEPFLRRARAGEYVRKVNINLGRDWMERHGLALPAGTRRIALPLGSEDVAGFERLVRLPGTAAPLDRLEGEALALTLVARSFARLAPAAAGRALAPHDRRRLARIEAFLRDGTGPLPGLGEIAREGGVSLSTLRRLYREAHGTTVQAHLRRIRLESARRALRADAVPVAEAARIAGYGSPENFATAYRRAYGEPPSASRRGAVPLPPH
ncbi:AraC family transcriptional regulator [Mangrovicoccus sp. HB161399]|uniref:helix-turn-helix transcriptional regulator n=1 Tax=Mangrovicoccus sp. HB161399 TaxID=2720392 RepID=UPI001552A270|nr:AraC family transcriptional regulator [Mangrovicoccus sp. HB161399]